VLLQDTGGGAGVGQVMFVFSDTSPSSRISFLFQFSSTGSTAIATQHIFFPNVSP
jgi:hypothetical protein